MEDGKMFYVVCVTIGLIVILLGVAFEEDEA